MKIERERGSVPSVKTEILRYLPATRPLQRRGNILGPMDPRVTVTDQWVHVQEVNDEVGRTNNCTNVRTSMPVALIQPGDVLREPCRFRCCSGQVASSRNVRHTHSRQRRHINSIALAYLSVHWYQSATSIANRMNIMCANGSPINPPETRDSERCFVRYNRDKEYSRCRSDRRAKLV